jgi:hypothetical protein
MTTILLILALLMGSIADTPAALDGEPVDCQRCICSLGETGVGWPEPPYEVCESGVWWEVCCG